MSGVAKVAAAGVCARQILGLPFPVGIVVISRGEGTVTVHHFADATEVVAVVVVASPDAASLALFSLGEVSAVDAGYSGIGGVAAEEIFALEKIVITGGFRGADFLNPLAALAEDVIAKFRGFVRTRSPVDPHQPVERVPRVAADAVAEHISVRIVGRSRGGGRGKGEGVGVV